MSPYAAVPIVMLLLLGSAALWFLLLSRLLRHMARFHPALREEIGSPDLSSPSTARPWWPMIHYLRSRRDRTLHDPELVRLGDAMRWFLGLYGLMFLALLIYGASLAG